MAYQEVEYEGWGKRLSQGVGGFVIGAILFLASFAVLFWNEGRAVHMAKALEEGQASAVTASPDTIDPANDGKLVCVAGEASTSEILKDPQFGLSLPALRLNRDVEIYQYKEEKHEEDKKEFGGKVKKVTTYTYPAGWVKEPIDSSSFKDPDAPKNRGTKPYSDQALQAKEVKLGAFTLTSDQVGHIGPAEKVPVTSAVLAELPEDLKKKLKLTSDGALYQCFDDKGDPASAQIGDVRISFQAVKSPQAITVAAQQFKGTFSPWHSQAGGVDLNVLKMGLKTKDELFVALQQENNTLTWILRLVGFILMAAGIFLVFRPLVVLADVIPFLGNLMSMGIGLFAICLAVPLTLVTIAIGWIVYRPLLGIGLLVASGAIVVGLIYLTRGRKKVVAKG